MKHMVAIKIISKTFVTAAIFVIPLRCFAGQPYPVVGICHLVENMSNYNGKVIELHSEVKFTEHGRQLFDPQCKVPGVIGLSIDDRQYKNPKTISWIRKIFAHGGHASITIIGRPVQKPFGHFLGYFILQDVIEKGNQGKRIQP